MSGVLLLQFHDDVSDEEAVQRLMFDFDRFIQVGRAAGFIPDKVTVLTDTTRVKGAGAVMDTYTLIRKAIRKLLKRLGYALSGPACRMARRLSAPDRLNWGTSPQKDRRNHPKVGCQPPQNDSARR